MLQMEDLFNSFLTNANFSSNTNLIFSVPTYIYLPKRGMRRISCNVNTNHFFFNNILGDFSLFFIFLVPFLVPTAKAWVTSKDPLRPKA